MRRRSVWTRMGIAIFVVLSVVAAACTNGDGDDPDPTSAPTTEPDGGSDTDGDGDGGDDGDVVDDHDPDGTVRIVGGVLFNQWDPHKQGFASEQAFTFMLFDRLTELDTETLEPVPALATSWEFSEDPAYLELSLRDDVAFHDGTPVDAEAVKLSLERGKSLEGSTVAPLLEAISSVEVVDEFTVRLNLGQGGAHLPATFSTNVGAIVNVAALEGVDLAADPPAAAGSGPYVVADAQPSEFAHFERAPGAHWDPTTGRAARIEVTFVGDPATRLNGIQAGQYDVAQITGVDVEQAAELAQGDDYDEYIWQIGTSFSLLFNADRPAVSDERVRQAVYQAIDRGAIVDDLFDGRCGLTSQPFPDGHWAADPTIADLNPYDPDAAGQLFSDAGGDSFVLTHGAGGLFEPIALAVSGFLDEAGVEHELQAMGVGDAIGQFQQGESDSFLLVVQGEPDPDLLMRTYFLGGYNLVPESAEADIEALATQALDPTLSQQERGELYAGLFRMAAEQAWYVPLCRIEQSWLYDSEILGIEDMRGEWTGIPDFRRLAVAP